MENEEKFNINKITDIMKTLRGPNGCSWDRKQTHKSLRRYLIEESAEVLEALDEGNSENICDELGDLLLQIVFHAQIAEERGDFNMQDVIDGISNKMIRRHPHVFGNTTAKNEAEVRKNWEEIKAQEKTHKERNLMDGIPKDLPALLKAQKIQEKAAKVGFVWDDVNGVWDKVDEEILEFKEAISAKNQENMEKEAGDILFSLINLLEWYKISGENALRRTNSKFIRRFNYIEQEVKASNKKWDAFTLEELDNLWERAKKVEKD